MKKGNRREALKHKLILLLFVLPIALYVGHSLLKNTAFYPQFLMGSTEKSQKEKLSLYLHHINQGDWYIDKMEWQKAIIQYTEARKLFPETYDSNYRLALGYTYSCYYEKRNCEAAKYAIARLEEDFQADAKSRELKAFVYK